MREDTISINGVLYDAKTGQPVAGGKQSTSQKKKVAVRQPKQIAVKTASAPRSSVSQAAKRKPTPSRTLNRQVVKKPKSKKHEARSTKQGTIAKSQSVKTATNRQRSTPSSQPIPPRIVYRGIKRPKTTSSVTAKASARLNEIEEKRNIKFISIVVGICLLVAVAGVTLAYFFVPSFSVWVAAQRADVNAVLPVYSPPGYKVSGTAEGSLGLVTINYNSDSLGNSYSLTQANSNWDSNGVLENKVKPLGGSHQTLSQKGLTIYRYSTGAVWVNGGILYTITDEGKLSNEQILQIVDGI